MPNGKYVWCERTSRELIPTFLLDLFLCALSNHLGEPDGLLFPNIVEKAGYSKSCSTQFS